MVEFTVFAWDPQKAASNLDNQGVDFEEATSALLDPQARLAIDPAQPGSGTRFVLLGMAAQRRVPVVCRIYQEDEHVIRILSARKASPGEAAQYLLGSC